MPPRLAALSAEVDVNDAAAILRFLALILHGVAGCAALGLVSMTGAMAVVCLVIAVLTGCATAAALRGRPITLYVAFGLVIGHSCWVLISAVSRGNPLWLITMLPAAVTVVWLLTAP